MKKAGIVLLAAAVLVLGLMAAAMLFARQGKSPQEEVSVSAVTPEEELALWSKKYVEFLIPSGDWWERSWSAPEELDPDCMVNICAYNNLLELPTQPEDRTIAQGAIYTAPQAPAQQVEQALEKYFAVSPEYLRTSKLYNPEKETYTMLCGWGGGWGVWATGGQRDGDQIRLEISSGSYEAPQNARPVGELLVQDLPDGGWKYLSYTCLEEPVEELPAEEVEQLSRDYVELLAPGGNWWESSWSSPEELTADQLVEVCAYNNLLELSTQPEDHIIAAPAQQVEQALAEHFDVSAEHLRTSQYYDPENETYGLPLDGGGDWSAWAVSARRDGDRLELEIAAGSTDDKENAATHGWLTVELLPDGGWMYRSFTQYADMTE